MAEYVEPEDRPLVYPYEDTIDDIIDRHEHLDTATRALANDAAILGDVIRAMRGEHWLDDWRLCDARIVIRHDGAKVVVSIDPGATSFVSLDPLGLLVNYRAAVPPIFHRLINTWVARTCPPTTVTTGFSR